MPTTFARAPLACPDPLRKSAHVPLGSPEGANHFYKDLLGHKVHSQRYCKDRLGSPEGANHFCKDLLVHKVHSQRYCKDLLGGPDSSMQLRCAFAHLGSDVTAGYNVRV